MARRALTAAGLALCGAGLLTATAGAATGPSQFPVTAAVQAGDSAGYPANATTNDLCSAAAMRGVTFQLNGGAPVATLGELGDPPAGAEVRMNWRGNTDECVGEFAVLVTKASISDTFIPADPQELLEPFAAAALNGEEGSVSLDLPSTPTCFRQIDAVVGLPLALVGGVGTPTVGNFYSGSFGGSVARTDERNMLISANNGAEPDCTPGTTTTTSTTEPPTTTTEPPGTTTTAGPTTTTEPATLTTAAPNDTAVVTSSTRRSMPATGTSNAQAGLAAAALIISGTVLVAIGRRQKAAL